MACDRRRAHSEFCVEPLEARVCLSVALSASEPPLLSPADLARFGEVRTLGGEPSEGWSSQWFAPVESGEPEGPELLSDDGETDADIYNFVTKPTATSGDPAPGAGAPAAGSASRAFQHGVVRWLSADDGKADAGALEFGAAIRASML